MAHRSSIDGDFTTPDGDASEADAASDSDSDAEEHVLEKDQRTPSSSSTASRELSGEEDVTSKPGLKEKLRKWKEERDELGRQHKGCECKVGVDLLPY